MLQVVLNTPKNPYFIQAAEKLSTPKNPGIENSNPIKSFNHPRHLEYTPPPPRELTSLS